MQQIHVTQDEIRTYHAVRFLAAQLKQVFPQVQDEFFTTVLPYQGNGIDLASGLALDFVSDKNRQGDHHLIYVVTPWGNSPILSSEQYWAEGDAIKVFNVIVQHNFAENKKSLEVADSNHVLYDITCVNNSALPFVTWYRNADLAARRLMSDAITAYNGNQWRLLQNLYALRQMDSADDISMLMGNVRIQ